MAPRVLVIGYGNTLRGDDGVGPRVATAAATLTGVDVCVVHQLTPDLASALALVDVAIFVDARPSDEDGAVEVSVLVPGGDGSALGHASDPHGLLALTGALYGRCPHAWWVTVPAVSFELGEELSPTTRRAVPHAVDIVAELVQEVGMEVLERDLTLLRVS
jgi:hydrogenase maturation protease